MLDTNDKKVLAKLMAAGRTSWAELGALLGLSAPAAADRVRKLEERGAIKGYAAIVDPEALGNDLAAYVAISLDDQKERDAFLAKVHSNPQILECHHVAGEGDYLLKIRCVGTRQLERLISAELKSIPGVRTKTTVILSTIKETPILPLAEE